MPDEAENIVLEHLRAMRAGQDALRQDMQDGFARVGQRIDRLETELRGLSYIVRTAIGRRPSRHSDLKTRVGALENRSDQPR